jgi:hypothetical protein
MDARELRNEERLVEKGAAGSCPSLAREETP